MLSASQTLRTVTSCSSRASLTPAATAPCCGRLTDMSFEPGRRCTSPRLSSSRSASRTVERLTPNCRASSVSEGSRSPSRSARLDDARADRRGHLAVGGLEVDLVELDAHAALSKSSRPISMRRISWVPAPIS